MSRATGRGGNSRQSPFPAAPMGSIREVIPIAQGASSILIDGDNDCLNMMVTTALTGSEAPDLGESSPKVGIGSVGIVPFDQLRHASSDRPEPANCFLSSSRSAHIPSMLVSIRSSRPPQRPWRYLPVEVGGFHRTAGGLACAPARFRLVVGQAARDSRSAKALSIWRRAAIIGRPSLSRVESGSIAA
jgi:hypothetical protein